MVGHQNGCKKFQKEGTYRMMIATSTLVRAQSRTEVMQTLRKDYHVLRAAYSYLR